MCIPAFTGKPFRVGTVGTLETIDFEETVCQVMQDGGCCVGKTPVPGFTRDKVVDALRRYTGDPDAAYEYLNFDL